MADANGYTTIRIKESSRKKLELLREGTGLTLSDIIEKLLLDVGGTIIDDITNISRDNTAFTLQYYDFDTKEVTYRDVSFQELRLSKVGDKITPQPNPSQHHQIEIAEILYVDESSVFVRINETVTGESQNISLQELLHIDLF